MFPLFLVISSIESTDYCYEDLCNGRVNVGCDPPPSTGGDRCEGMSPAEVPIGSALRSRILDRHNKRRSTLATGGLSSFPPASRMPTLVWDDELASQAGHNARSCIFEHDECRNTEDFAWAGQNLAITKYYGKSYTIESLIDGFIDAWWNEYQNTSPSYIDRYPRNYIGPAIGHFTQMASDRTWKVGCAIQYWLEDDRWITYYFVCDYSYTNVVDRPVYRQGRTASRCTTGTKQLYPGLCSVNEVVNSAP